MERFVDDKDAQILTCAACGELFDWSSGEQKFYRERNLAEPRRCKPCRVVNKAKRDAVHQGQNDERLRQETRTTIGDVIRKYLS